MSRWHTLLLREPEILFLLDPAGCLQAVENAFSAYARGQAELPTVINLTSEQVLVTNGGAEANFTALWGLLERAYTPPMAGAIAFFRFKLPISSSALFDRLRIEPSVLITPGDQFGLGKYVRVGYGYEIDYTLKGLARVDIALNQLSKKSTRSRVVPSVMSRQGAA
jgi:aspartate/methionine/tyrosine aminotransferase